MNTIFKGIHTGNRRTLLQWGDNQSSYPLDSNSIYKITCEALLVRINGEVVSGHRYCLLKTGFIDVEIIYDGIFNRDYHFSNYDGLVIPSVVVIPDTITRSISVIAIGGDAGHVFKVVTMMNALQVP